MNEDLKEFLVFVVVMLAGLLLLAGLVWVLVFIEPPHPSYLPCNCPREMIETQHGRFHIKKTIIYHTQGCHNA
jgi:hypothetical protein